MLKRDEDEVARWRARDPIKLWREVLADQGVLSEAEADAITEKIQAEMEAAIAFAEQSPDPVPEDLMRDIYS
jgi:pyruvate dehydrogenase E1 component alpha subunit